MLCLSTGRLTAERRKNEANQSKMCRSTSDLICFRCLFPFKSYVVRSAINLCTQRKKFQRPERNGTKRVSNAVRRRRRPSTSFPQPFASFQVFVRKCWNRRHSPNTKEIFSVNNAMRANSGESVRKHVERSRSLFFRRPKGVGFGQGAGALGMDTGEHLGNRSGSEMS